MNDPKNALARLRDKTERMLGVSEQERSDAQALITLFDSDGVEIDTLKARVAELEAQVRAKEAEARSAELGASVVVSVAQITADATSLPQVGERVATLCAEYGVSTKQPPDRLIVELLNAGEVRAKRAEAQVAAVRTVALNTLALGDDDVRPDDILRALNEVKDEDEVKDAAKTPEPVEKVFDIYSFGLFYMSVCTNMSPAEAELHARKNNPSGTQNGWRISQETFQSGEPNPCPCDRNPDRIHILFQC